MRHGIPFYFVIILILSTLQLGTLTAQTTKMYVNVPEENLRNAPNGRKLGTLIDGTEMLVLVEKENWVKVQITGWIWKPSLTTVKKIVEQGEYRALHILVKTREEAESIKSQLAQGESFQELAKKKSIAPSAATGGDLGYFSRGDFDPKVETIILGLQVDQVSDIIETPYGFNLFKRVK